MNQDAQVERTNRKMKAEAEREPGALRGKLKIFLGYAAGVGKTRAMLEFASRQMRAGVDVVVGCIDTHGQGELEQLKALLVCGEIQTSSRVSGLDLDSLLLRRPALVVVDDLAFTNPPEFRHRRRFQDVEELLAAGIDVLTTLNIFQLESLKDVIFQITGQKVIETVPDWIFEQAAEIALVDIPPSELVQRLKEKKVDIAELASLDVNQFYREGNLTALRELAMRRAAERIDVQMRSYMSQKAIQGPWPAGERILVCLSSHPLGERLVRAGKKLADEVKAEWFVIFVETPGHLQMPETNRRRLEENLKRAEQLGAHVLKLSGNSVAEEIIRFCREYNITRIIAGRPTRSRWRELFKPSVVDQIIRNSGRVDVFVVSEEQDQLQQIQIRRWLPHRPLARYLGSIALVGMATLFSLVIHPFIDPVNLVMIFLAAVVLSAIFLGRGPSLLASVLSVLMFDFFIINPRFSLAVADTQYLITFAAFLLVALIISNSALLLRGQVQALQDKEKDTRLINHFSQELTGAATLDQVMTITLDNLAGLFKGESAIFLVEDNHLKMKKSTQKFQLNPEETAAAEWALKNIKPAGRGTETHSALQSHFIPLRTSRGVTGILAIQSREFLSPLPQDKHTLLAGLSSLAALAIERAEFAQDAMQAETLRAAERLQSALLNSISHQLRTPLATITGVLTSLSVSEKSKNETGRLPAEVRGELLDSATQQAQTLNRLVENLLAMTRLEAGFTRVNCQPGDIQDLIGAVMDQMADTLSTCKVSVDIPPNLPPALMDAVLTGQVLVNLLENSCKFSPPGSSVQISASLAGETLEFRVSDQGPGFPPEDIPHVFEKFYRGKRTAHIPGTGLGLSICKGIVEAQGGSIWAENNPEGGASLIFTLPVYHDSEQEGTL